MDNFMIDYDLQATLTRALSTPLALSSLHPNQRSLQITLIDDTLFITNFIKTEVHSIMASRTEVEVATSGPPTPRPFLSFRAESVSSASAASPKIGEVRIQVQVDPHLEVLKAKAHVSILEKAAQLHTLTKSLDEKLALAKEIESEKDEEVEALKSKYDLMKKAYEGKEVMLRELEGQKQNFVLAFSIDKGDGDKLSLRKAELEIIKMKATLVEFEIEMMEAEMEIKAKLAMKSAVTPKSAETRAEADDIQQQITTLEDEIKKDKAEWDDKYGASSACTVNGATPQDQLVQQEVKDLKEKIQQMLPLYWIGHATRERYVEWELKHYRGQSVSREVENEGQDAWRWGKVLADATLYLDFSPKPRISAEEFEHMYGISPTLAWEHRDFNTLINIIGWKQDLRKLRSSYPRSETFGVHFDKVFRKIVTDSEVKCDDEVRNDQELMASYLVMQEEHDKARASHSSQWGGRGQPQKQMSSFDRRNVSRS
ncbi:hypothetical protein EG329_011740 [Mollisiaceae sp. DMI_Dod_QoI]|nr:hypothetical protein EG329_011740 [Helotiales sp. DMI_Dod_QoI]